MSALVLVVLSVAVASCAAPGGGGWETLHGDASNSGFADTTTAPAELPIRRVSDLGDFAPGSGPVVAADGTVYLGNIQGLLRAFTPAGDPKWMRDTPGHKIVASPAIGADGSVYVIGSRVARDHRGTTVVTRYDSTLYRFVPGGGLLWVSSFPQRDQQGTGATSASPVIWRSGADEVIMVPVLYRLLAGYEMRLLAFSTAGGVLFDQKVTAWGYGDLTGEADWGDVLCVVVPICFNKMFGLDPTVRLPNVNQLNHDVEPPMPSVGIFRNGGTAPVVVVADNHQNLVGYSFSRAQGFQETFRKHLTNDRLSMSSPVLLRDGHSVIRANGRRQAWALFAGPHPLNWTEVVTPMSGSTPTLTVDGRIVIVDRPGGVTVIATAPGRSVVGRIALEGESIAPAAASCTHVFVSTASELVTLDAGATTVVTRFNWRDGGLSSPAIAPSGAVYALAGDRLHIFAAPPSRGFGLPSAVVRSCVDRPLLDPGSGGATR